MLIVIETTNIFRHLQMNHLKTRLISRKSPGNIALGALDAPARDVYYVERIDLV